MPTPSTFFPVIFLLSSLLTTELNLLLLPQGHIGPQTHFFIQAQHHQSGVGVLFYQIHAVNILLFDDFFSFYFFVAIFSFLQIAFSNLYQTRLAPSLHHDFKFLSPFLALFDDISSSTCSVCKQLILFLLFWNSTLRHRRSDCAF